jgi:hypothetical protein
MTLEQIIRDLGLKVLTVPCDFSKIEPSAGYASDLLSCVMSGAAHHGIWVTLQAHTNIVAVAALLELSAVIITEGAEPDAATITKANEENIILLQSSKNTYYIVGKLWESGLQA